MPRVSFNRAAQEAIERAGEQRRQQLRVELRMSPRSKTPHELLGVVGGEYDYDERRFVGLDEERFTGTERLARVWEVEDLQREAAEYWLAWFGAYLTGDWDAFTARHGRRPFSLWTVGGRRRGKTWLGVRLLAAFVLANPSAELPAWLVSPTEDDFAEGKELWREMTRALPPSWFTWNYRDLCCTFVNGGRINFYGAHRAEKLKDGAMSYVFWNEVQKSQGRLRALNNLRGGAADKGTLIHCAANPARNADEYWIEEIFEGLEAGTVEGRLLDFRGDNPHVNEAALDSMAAEMSTRDYAIERGGARMPRPDIVMYEYVDNATGNVRSQPADGEITEYFLQRKLGRPFAAVVSADFQLAPHMAAVVKLFFPDPYDVDGAISWTVDEALVEQGDEDDLIDVLEANGWNGEDCAVVADASGEWQQGDRKRGKVTGRGSFDMFRRRGWRHIFKPDPRSDRNPLILERVAVGNARLARTDPNDQNHVIRRAFISPTCVHTREALKKWPNGKDGFPSRRSQYSHVGDAWTYSEYRLWPRVHKPKVKPRDPKVIDLHGRDDRAFADGSDRDDDLPPGLRRY